MNVYVLLNPTAYFTINRRYYEEVDFKPFNREYFRSRERIYLYPQELIFSVFGTRFPEWVFEEEEREFIIEEYATEQRDGYLLLLFDREYSVYRFGVYIASTGDLEWDKDIEFLRGLSKFLIYYYVEFQSIHYEKPLEELQVELERLAKEIQKVIKDRLGKDAQVFIVVPTLLAFTL